MKFRNKILTVLLMLTASVTEVLAQDITGQVVDADGYGIPQASVRYRGQKIAAVSDAMGYFTIERHNGWALQFTSLGYKSQTVKVGPDSKDLRVTLADDSKQLSEVVVRSKRGKYRKKDNPAVELMRRVIAAKKRTDLSNHDYYQFEKYQKLTVSVNDIQPEDLEKGILTRLKWVQEQMEVSPLNDKLVLPISVDETVTQHIYRKSPKSEKTIVQGHQAQGLTNIIQTGELMNTMLKDIFTDVDIYDDHIRLLKYPFPSPIGSSAISFYRFYIEDTIYVDKDLCYHLQFIPANQQDFGFRGELYVLADSTLHVKRCDMTLPKATGVNWVDNMRIEQEYAQLPNGEWVLTIDDMLVEMSLTDFLTKALVVRTTRKSDYSFEPISKKEFKGKAAIRQHQDSQLRDDAFWAAHRSVELTGSEAKMGSFMEKMAERKNFKWILLGIQALMENYVETGSKKSPSLFDIGPINTFFSYNFIDGIRLRAAGRTTAHLNPHLFWNGYYAYGTKSHKSYYGTEITYSLNKKKNMPYEFPMRNISFSSSYDVMSPSDKFLIHNKDNAFMAFRTQTVKQMYFYNRQQLSFVYETDWNLGIRSSLKTESNEPTGELWFMRQPDLGGDLVRKIRTTEWKVGLSYAPGQQYINTKQNRFRLNLDAPELSLSHTMGINHLLGGQYGYHVTEIGLYKRFWMGTWGCVDARLDMAAQWSKVPFPLLLIPPINLSYFEHSNTFNMLRNMEFLNDRYAFLSLAWDLNGKLLNRVPLIKKLKWREYVAFKAMWGKLTDKNNPFLEQNQGDTMLFQFPDGVNVMESNPYCEFVVGVHNIFKFFAVDYVRRLSYTDDPEVKKNGIRFGFTMTF